MWLVVGLGNPGREYAGNRHNVGFLVADLLARRTNVTLRRHGRAVADAGTARLGVGIDAPQLLIVKPLTFMNRSGAAVSGLANFYKIAPERVIAVHDELDLDFGQVRAKFGGGEGGHNGLRSLTASLSTRDYHRVRFGIGRPPGRQDAADFVLSDFPAAQRADLDYLVDRSADMVEAIMTHGLEWAQNAYHGG